MLTGSDRSSAPSGLAWPGRAGGRGSQRETLSCLGGGAPHYGGSGRERGWGVGPTRKLGRDGRRGQQNRWASPPDVASVDVFLRTLWPQNAATEQLRAPATADHAGPEAVWPGAVTASLFLSAPLPSGRVCPPGRWGREKRGRRRLLGPVPSADRDPQAMPGCRERERCEGPDVSSPMFSVPPSLPTGRRWRVLGVESGSFKLSLQAPAEHRSRPSGTCLLPPHPQPEGGSWHPSRAA